MQDISDIHLNMHQGTQTEDLILGQKEDQQDDRSDIQMTCSVREQRLERMRRREVERQRQSGSSEVQQLILRLGLDWEIRVKEKKQHSLSLHLLETDDLMTLNQDLMRTICRGLSQLTSGRVVSLCPECPVCLETMRPLSAMVQCVSGHLLCLHCASRMVVLVCPTCRGEIKGRAGVMEQLLTGILDQASIEQEIQRFNSLNYKLFLVKQ